MQLNKFIASSKDYSRPETKYLIKKGHVLLNNDTAYKPRQQIQLDNQVSINSEIIYQRQARYFMLNYVCATTGSNHPTVLDLIGEPKRNKLQIVGRLDINTTGLVLITNDDRWNHQITAPNNSATNIIGSHLAGTLMKR